MWIIGVISNQILANSSQIAETKIVVHITGQVQKTGIVVLPEGARIADAIEKSGGLTKNANLDKVNLAYLLEDGQKIYIPSKYDKDDVAYISSENGNGVIIENTNSQQKANKKVNINTASQGDIEVLPGIGPSIASKIIEYRQQNGKFKKLDDLKNVKGIGDAKFNIIKDYVVVK